MGTEITCYSAPNNRQQGSRAVAVPTWAGPCAFLAGQYSYRRL